MNFVFLLIPLSCIVSFLLGALIFYGMGRFSGMEDALMELRAHREQRRLKAQIEKTSAPKQAADPRCAFCEFVEAGEFDDERDEALYLRHLKIAHCLEH